MIDSIVNKWLDKTKTDLIKNYSKLGLKASGQWPKGLDGFIKHNTSNIKVGMFGYRYTGALENGRKKTRSTAAKGNPTLVEIIRKWIDDKGLTPKKGSTKDKMASGIAYNIHKNGIKVPNKHNKGGLVTDVVTKARLETLVKDIGNATIKDFKSKIIKELK